MAQDYREDLHAFRTCASRLTFDGGFVLDARHVSGMRRLEPLLATRSRGNTVTSRAALSCAPAIVSEELVLSIADISIWTAVLAGALSFLSPCVLPLVPPYLCYMAGVSVDQFRVTNGTAAVATRRAVLPSALLFTLGFSTVFIALGIGASSVGLLLRQHMDLLSRIGGIVVIIMGLHFLGVLRIGLLGREARFQGGGKPATLSGAYIMGLAFGFGWTPCIGPVLGTILGVAAARDTVSEGAVLLAVYSLGLAIPFWIAAAFSGAFMGFLSRFRRHLGLVEKIMGGLLVVAGLAFLFGLVSTVSIWFQQTFPVLMQIG